MRGIYVMLLRVPFGVSLLVGGLGTITLYPGYYAYVGSAMGGLEQRISRHLRSEKKTHWHIDYLLPRSVLCGLLVAETDEPKEHELATRLSSSLVFVKGFGSSDCKCGGHLFYSPDLDELINHIVKAAKEMGLEMKKWNHETGRRV